jgi:pimeloyl-ACP methyl ester carboxylesterase
MIKYHRFKETKVRFSDKGKGRVVVLLHGFLFSLEIWDELSTHLSKRFRVIAIDLPGHGETDSIGYFHSMELLAECVKSVLNKLRLRKYVIVGHSMGGYAALAFAELYPDNIKGLCLFHSTALADSPEKKEGRERAIAIAKNNRTKFIRELIENLFAEENRRTMKPEIKRAKGIAAQTGNRSIIAALEGMKERSNREIILKFAQYPVLFILGKKDSVIPFESMESQVNLPKSAEVLALGHAGHMGFIENKELTFKTLYSFVSRCFRKS